MIHKWFKFFILVVFFLFCLSGCSDSKKTAKIGVSIGGGTAARWALEKGYMEEHAKELGISLDMRFRMNESEEIQKEDCFELIDSGIDVLILMPRNTETAKAILDYAKQKKVKVLNYARVIMNESVDLFVGYDTRQIGQAMGQYLAETVYKGDYILLRGESSDNNAALIYEGAASCIEPIREDINIILDADVPKWSADEAKKLVLDAVRKNGNHVDAILAPNDSIAEGCAEALKELNVTEHVVITGMDAELEAVRRIVAGTQDVTIYMDFKELAYRAVEEAYHMAASQKADVNSRFDNGFNGGIDACLVSGKLVTRQNLDKVLIDSGCFTEEEVYAKE